MVNNLKNSETNAKDLEEDMANLKELLDKAKEDLTIPKNTYKYVIFGIALSYFGVIIGVISIASENYIGGVINFFVSLFTLYRSFWLLQSSLNLFVKQKNIYLVNRSIDLINKLRDKNIVLEVEENE